MTPLGKIIITSGIIFFTFSTLMWIFTTNWQWFAGGGAILVGTTLTSAVVSAETKTTTRSQNHSVRYSPANGNNGNDKETNTTSEPITQGRIEDDDPFSPRS